MHTAHASGSHGPDTPIHIHRSSIWSSRPYIHTYIVDGRRTATRTVGRRFLQRQHATFFNRPRTSREELNKFLFFFDLLIYIGVLATFDDAACRHAASRRRRLQSLIIFFFCFRLMSRLAMSIVDPSGFPSPCMHELLVLIYSPVRIPITKKKNRVETSQERSMHY